MVSDFREALQHPVRWKLSLVQSQTPKTTGTSKSKKFWASFLIGGRHRRCGRHVRHRIFTTWIARNEFDTKFSMHEATNLHCLRWVNMTKWYFYRTFKPDIEFHYFHPCIPVNFASNFQRNSPPVTHHMLKAWQSVYEIFQGSNICPGFDHRCSGDLTKIQPLNLVQLSPHSCII